MTTLKKITKCKFSTRIKLKLTTYLKAMIYKTENWS